MNAPSSRRRCPFCAEDIHPDAKKCKHCGEHFDPHDRAARSFQLWSPGTAAVLSFFIPGLGQIYKGQLGRGFLFLITTPLAYLMLILPGLACHVFAVIDAYTNPTSQLSSMSVDVPLDEAAHDGNRHRSWQNHPLNHWTGISILAIALLGGIALLFQ